MGLLVLTILIVAGSIYGIDKMHNYYKNLTFQQSLNDGELKQAFSDTLVQCFLHNRSDEELEAYVSELEFRGLTYSLEVAK